MQRDNKFLRCEWCGDNDLYVKYHDKEWGVPLHDDKKLFELLSLEGAQAGLSWLTILKRREGYQKAFEHFDPKNVAKFNDLKIAKLLNDPSVIRNKLKILSVIKNAKAVVKIQAEYSSFNSYIWHFVNNKPIQHNYPKLSDIPNTDSYAVNMSTELQKNGFNFVGATICYAFMQASGMVNDHTASCFRHQQLL